MTKPGREQRVKQRKATEDVTMNMDVEPVAESSAAVEQNPNITDTAQQGNTGNTEGEALNMREVAVALDAAVNDSNDNSLRALLRSVDFDVLKVANLTFDRPDAIKAFAAVLSTAVMMSQDRASEAADRAADAEDRAAEAEDRAADADDRAADAESKASDAKAKAAEADKKAVQAHDKATTADNNCDGVFGRSVENAQAILGQGEHISALQRQIAALATIPPVAATSRADGHLAAANARLAERLHAAEQQLDELRQMINGAMLNTNPGDDIQATMGRMQVLADLRLRAEISLYERRDRQRQLELEQALQRVNDKLAAVDNEGAALASARQQDQAERAELRANFRGACIHLVASAFGDITPQELRDRLAPFYGSRN